MTTFKAVRIQGTKDEFGKSEFKMFIKGQGKIKDRSTGEQVKIRSNSPRKAEDIMKGLFFNGPEQYKVG